MSDHRMSVECATCKQSMFLSPGSEWPEQDLYCWWCAHEQIARLTAERDELLRLKPKLRTANEAARFCFEEMQSNDPDVFRARQYWPWLVAKEPNDE